VLVSQVQSVAEAVWSIGVTQFTHYRRRKEFGGLKADQVKRLMARQTRQRCNPAAMSSNLTAIQAVRAPPDRAGTGSSEPAHGQAEGSGNVAMADSGHSTWRQSQVVLSCAKH
jgi:hypothetical protein